MPLLVVFRRDSTDREMTDDDNVEPEPRGEQTPADEAETEQSKQIDEGTENPA
jgi:hypothetical protein